MPDSRALPDQRTRDLPGGVVPCGHCSLPISAAEAGSWTGKGDALLEAWHSRAPWGCLKAMGARVAALELAASVRREERDRYREALVRLVAWWDSNSDLPDETVEAER